MRQIKFKGLKDTIEPLTSKKQLKKQLQENATLGRNSSAGRNSDSQGESSLEKKSTESQASVGKGEDREVAQAQAEHLAARLHLPYREVDIRNTSAVHDVINTLTAIIIMKVTRRGSLEHFIRPPNNGNVDITSSIQQTRGCCIVRYIKTIL